MPYLRSAEPRRQVVLGGVEAGEVVFEEVDDAALLVERRNWDRELAEIAVRGFGCGRVVPVSRARRFGAHRAIDGHQIRRN